ncbi:MAG: hypothetical protein RLZZ292_93 [Bacteroidota bacterium]|jgi:predicted helicase
MKLSFDEIENGDQFEDLATEYFNSIQDEKILGVDVKKSGVGTDGGRDILVTFTITDSIKEFQRRWVVQCKFHKGNISTNKINDINIPTLLHSYKASGYLLICREDVTSKLSNLFESLEKECIFGHKYRFWNGSNFRSKLLRNQKILKQFFPEYYKNNLE